MISINFNNIKNTLASFSIFSISINRGENKKNDEPKEEIELKIIEEKQKLRFIDYKTTLGRSGIDLIEKIDDDILVYFFIQKDKDSSAWNLVVPVILEKSTGKINQFGQGYFALEGSGGGLSNTDSIMYHLKNHKERGYRVSIIPKVVDNKLLDDFEYVDSNVKLSNLIENSIDLINYRKNSFEWIFRKYAELMRKYKLE